MSAIAFLDYMGVTLFAVTGALSASRKQMDIIGFLFLATVTGIGGGTARDLILGVPVFWVAQPHYILACAGAAVVTFFSAHLVESRHKWLLWLDAIGLAAYGVFGAYKGLAVTGSPYVAVVMGMLTGTFGGILRDVLANEPSVLMRKEIYITAAMVGATCYVIASAAGLPEYAASAVGFAAALCLRGGSLLFGWNLPPYKSRPGRMPPGGPSKP
jgi:uncharacterized membrane protein YeiH